MFISIAPRLVLPLAQAIRHYYKSFAALASIIRPKIKALRPSFKEGLEDLVYGPPEPQVHFYDAQEQTTYGDPHDHEDTGYSRSVKYDINLNHFVRSNCFLVIQFQEEGRELLDLFSSKMFEASDEQMTKTNEPQISINNLATALKSAQQLLE